jgi:hypothetical protein
MRGPVEFFSLHLFAKMPEPLRLIVKKVAHAVTNGKPGFDERTTALGQKPTLRHAMRTLDLSLGPHEQVVHLAQIATMVRC